MKLYFFDQAIVACLLFSVSAFAQADPERELEDRMEIVYNLAQSGKADAQDAIRQLASQTSPEIPSAQFRLGQLLYQPSASSGAVKNESEAMELWARASRNGYGRASFALGNVYTKRESGVPTDVKLGLQFYELAIEQGWKNANSRTRLARALLTRSRASDCDRIRDHLTTAIAETSANASSEASQILTGADLQKLCPL